MAKPPIDQPIESDDAERISLGAAVAEARADRRPSVPHAQVRNQLIADAERARKRIEELSKRQRHAS